MRQPTSKPTNPFAEIDRLLGVEKEPTGTEWFTVREYAQSAGIVNSHADRRLEKLYKDGRIDRWRGYSRTTKRFTKKYRLKAVPAVARKRRQLP